MKLKTLLRGLDFFPSSEEIKYLERETKEIVESLKEKIMQLKIDADVFVGGSFAKKTLVKDMNYDIDIFVRFDWKEQGDLSEVLEKIIKLLRKSYKRTHGSRDYFQIEHDNKLTFEIIPVLRIKNIKQAQNVTDLSYFHVNYVRKKANKKIAREIILAKKFFKANGIYGAESYIHGFSGYGIECLIIYFKSLEKMLKELIKVKNERIVIDPAKKYKKRGDVFFELNESKLHSPIILIDPTWKERNILAGLSRDTFEKFKEIAKKFLKNPSARFFEPAELKLDKLKKNKGFVQLSLNTNRQEGDIGGTKMHKFSRFLILELKRYFDVMEWKFDYSGIGQRADLYLFLQSKGEIVKIGPPIKMKEAVKEFKKRNRKTFIKNGFVHASVKVEKNPKKFMDDYIKKNWDKINSMGIVEIKIN